MSLLDRVRTRTGSDLPDAELQEMIDGITAEIDALHGPAGQIMVDLGDPTDPTSRYTRTLRLLRPMDAAQAVEIVERDPGNDGADVAAITLDPADYAVLHGGRTLQRRFGGPNGRGYWAPLVTVTYTPIGVAAARDEATIKLMLLDLSYRGGLKSETAGDYAYTLSGNQAADREAILATLDPKLGMVMA